MRKLGLAIALIMTSLTLGPLETRAQGMESADSSEYLIKAGFIYNFAKFVEWPGIAFSKPNSPLVIGVLGNDDFAAVLEQIVAGKKIDARPFVVKRLKWGKEQLKDCHILFIASVEKSHNDEVIQILKGASILTIAETSGFAKRGGVINFTLEDSKVRFEVNVEAAKQADLNVSSRLLSLARVVQEGSIAR